MSQVSNYFPIHKNPLVKSLITAVLFILLLGCESGSIGDNHFTENGIDDAGIGIDGSGISVAGIDGSGLVSTGPIDAFGSIILRGVRFDIDNATITLNGELTTEDDLALGMYVNVVSTYHEDGATATATHVEFTHDLSGPVERVSVTSNRDYLAITVVGQTVLVHERDTVYFGTTFDTIAQSTWLNVSGLVVAEGRIVATYVESIEPHLEPSVRFTAKITEIDGERLTLSSGMIADVSGVNLGATFSTLSDSSTMAGNDFEIGQRIEVVGEIVIEETAVDELTALTTVRATTVDIDPGFEIPEFDTQEGERFTLMDNIDALTGDTSITVLGVDIDISGAALNPEGYPLSEGLPVRIIGTYDANGQRIASNIYIDQLTQEGRVTGLSLTEQQFTIEPIQSSDTALALTIPVEEQTTYRYRTGDDALNTFELSDLELNELVIVSLIRNANNQWVATDVVRTSTVTGASATNPAGHIRDDDSFVTVWEVSNGDLQITLPLMEAGEYNFTVDWGDGTLIDEISSSNQLETQHEYANPGIYDVVISGTLHGFAFNNHSDAGKLLEVSQWGDMRLSSETVSPGGYFYGAHRLKIPAMDLPDLTFTTNLSQAFRDASALDGKGELHRWNTSNVTNMSGMFQGATQFSHDLSQWQIGQVSDMSQMFTGSALTTAHYDALLEGWGAQTLQNNVTLDVGTTQYSGGSAANLARGSILTNANWTINDGGPLGNSRIWNGGGAQNNLSSADNWGGASIESTSQITINSGSDLITWDSPTTLAGIILDSGFGGTVMAEADTDLTVSNAMVVNDGRLSTDAVLSVDTYSQGADGALTLVLDSKVDGAYGRINVSGAITVDGTLTVINDGLTFISGDEFDIGMGGVISGAFDTVILPTLPQGLSWNTSNLYVTGVIEVIDVISAEFISTWRTTGVGETVTLPLLNGGNYNFNIDWGDGSSDTITAWDQAEATHTYATANTYTVTITGTLEGFAFNNAGDREKIQTISSWGNIKLSYDGYADGRFFYGASNLDITATNAPDMTYTTTLERAFRSSGIDDSGNFNSWNVETVTNMENTFHSSSDFNQPLSNWNTSSVTSMNGMFDNFGSGSAGTFNQDISSWNVSSVTDMSYMFRGQNNFNQNLGNWEVSSVQNFASLFQDASSFNNGGSASIGGWNLSSATDTGSMFTGTPFNQDIGGWDVSRVTNMAVMFNMASAFNQDIGGWNVAAVTNMREMLKENLAFDQDLSHWNVEAVSNMTDMLRGTTLSTTNYDALLIGWDALELQDNVTFHGGNSTYTEGGAAEAARTNIVTGPDNWTITDGGSAPP